MYQQGNLVERAGSGRDLKENRVNPRLNYNNPSFPGAYLQKMINNRIFEKCSKNRRLTFRKVNSTFGKNLQYLLQKQVQFIKCIIIKVIYYVIEEKINNTVAVLLYFNLIHFKYYISASFHLPTRLRVFMKYLYYCLCKIKITSHVITPKQMASKVL